MTDLPGMNDDPESGIFPFAFLCNTSAMIDACTFDATQPLRAFALRDYLPEPFG
jgi:hypothetical protein